MKKVTKALAGALALITAVSAFTGCDSGTANTSGDTSSTSSTTTTEPAKVISENSGVLEAVSNIEVNDDYKDIKVDTKIKWMAWWKIQEATPAVETFKSLYGTPENKPEGYEDTPDEQVFVNMMIANYADRYTQLSTKIQADDSPDCFPFEICNYPYSVYKNLFQSVDGILDFTTEDWADYKSAIDQFQWGGKNYCPIMDLNPASLLWYRKSVVENAGLEDPWTLFEDGEWTWSAFVDMCKTFTDVDAGKFAIDGWNPENNFVCTTGTPLIGIEDGKLVSNLNNANIEKCMEMLLAFDDTKEGYRYPRETLNNWATNIPEWVNGNILFFEDGTWRYEEHWYKYKARQGWDDDEVNFVPFPQMDGADEYYQAMKQDSIMLCAGSKNIDGYKAWIYANLLSTRDEDVKAAGRQQSIEEYDWTEELLDRLDILKDPSTFVPVFDFKNGIGVDIAGNDNQEYPVEQLTKYPYMNGETYTSVRAANQSVIETRITELNATVS